MWKPEYNGTMEEWYQCHGLPCDEYIEVQQKMKKLMKMSMQVEPDQDSSLDNPLTSGTIDGCIWLTPQQIDWMLEDAERDSRTRQKRKVLDFSRYPAFQWPLNRPIIYKFDGKHDESQKHIIRSAMRQWEENTCIRFNEVPMNQDVQESHIMVTREPSGCHSYVGRTIHYPQQLNLQDACIWEFGITVHEFGHALGLWHEQMRFDRDDYVDIVYENLGFYQGQFRRVDGTVSLGVPYDYGSVMHYSPKDGSANGKTVIEAKDPLYQSSMGQRSGLSFFDAKIVNAAYCSNVCRGPTLLPCQRGGYQDPNNCDRCKCPDGFGGAYCEWLASPKGANCGEEIRLGNDEVRTITSPGYGNAPYNDFIECSWLIRAPRNLKVELQFEDDFGVFCHNQRECYHWVEVKYKTDKGMYGPRFCCYDTPHVMLRSEDEEMVIIFRTNFTVTQTFLNHLHTGFKASVRAVSDSGPYTQMPTTESTTVPTTTITTTTADQPSSTRVTRPFSTLPSNRNDPCAPGLRQGGWSAWSCWSDTCDYGVRVRYRQCNEPYPVGPNMYCQGSPQESERCGTTTEDPTTPTPCVSGTDTIFAVDSSGSIGRTNFDRMTNDIFTLIASFDRDFPGNQDPKKVRTGIVVYSDRAEAVNELEDPNLPTGLRFYASNTNTHLAIDLATTQMFTPNKGDRPQNPNVLVVLTDGQSTERNLTMKAATEAKNAGIKIIAVGIGDHVDTTELEHMVSNAATDVYTVNDFNELKAELTRLFSCN
uniref:Metalloendopeptidase n=1 Tax=Perinereis aibuhitensis TaxID=126650 RepID=A0A8A6NIY8_PERAI|nr:astacin [Perinereis aibuhitensis]